mmetsp:Transcript_17851/g.51170  ORF Transcript_17851/g.51170 Transcript_17851/m.51170 type:complete len:262 (+) Transcript_17851:385-1170(+)
MRRRESASQRTLRTWLLCPLREWCGACSTRTGYLKRLTRPKSSPLASSCRSLLRETLLMSVPSANLGQMPMTSKPRVDVNVSHSMSRWLAAWLTRCMACMSQTSRSWAPHALCRNRESRDQSRCSTKELWPLRRPRCAKPDRTWYTSTKLSRDATARSCPFGLNRISWIASRQCVASNTCANVPDSSTQKPPLDMPTAINCLSGAPLRPSGETSTQMARSERESECTSCDDSASQMFSLRSSPAVQNALGLLGCEAKPARS